MIGQDVHLIIHWYNNTLVAFLFAGKDMLSYQVALYGPSVISSFCTLTASWLDRHWNLRLSIILS